MPSPSSVDTKHEKYNQASPSWVKLRDVIAGEDQIKSKTTTYLPMLEDDMAESFYDYYLNRAVFFEATERTLAALTGLAFRKSPTIKFEDQDKPENNDFVEFLTSVTSDKWTIDTYAAYVLREVLSVGRGGTLVDFPRANGDQTIAQAERENKKPYLVFYAAENIINWRTTTVNNKTITSLVVLREAIDKAPEDESDFNVEQEYQYRVLDLDAAGHYRQRIFDDKTDQVGGDIYPTIKGELFTEIPFIFHAPFGKWSNIEKPPLLPLANLNIHHYQLMADQAHGLRYVALPTPVITGVDEKSAPNIIGPQQLWALDNEQAKAYMLEVQGFGFKSIADAIKALEMKMANVGSIFIESYAATNETAHAARIRHGTQTSQLADICDAISDQLTAVLSIAAKWLGMDLRFQLRINKDFVPADMDPQMLQMLVFALQAGTISYPTYYDQLRRADIVDTVSHHDDEIERIKKYKQFVVVDKQQGDPTSPKIPPGDKRFT